MRTLKTISVMLPMTLLLACGSGGGGGYSTTAPSIQPTLIQDEANLVDIENGTEAEIAEMENSVDDDDNDFTLTINAASIETLRKKHQHNSFGIWIDDRVIAHGIDPTDGRFRITGKGKGVFVGGEYTIDKMIDDTFNRAVYTGSTVARRSDGDIEAGSVRIELKVKNDELKRMDFLFSGTDYDWKKKLKFGKNADFGGNEFGTRKSRFKNGTMRGIKGTFVYSPEHDEAAIWGWFGNKKIGVDKGTFGATRDSVEIK